MPFKSSIIQFRSHNYIINCLKISSTVFRVAYHVISGHVRSMNVKWHMCTYHVPLVAQVAQGDSLISQLKIVITVRKEVLRVIPLRRVQI